MPATCLQADLHPSRQACRKTAGHPAGEPAPKHGTATCQNQHVPLPLPCRHITPLERGREAAAGGGGGAAAMLASPASPQGQQADAEGSTSGGSKGTSSKLAKPTVFENPLASHPIPGDGEPPAAASPAAAAVSPAASPPRPKGGARRRLDAAPPSPVSSVGGASGRSVGAPSEGHVRRLTQNLVEILESLSGSVALPGQHQRTASAGSSRGTPALR
ncbi:hypothetical protein ABPG75_007800 [Micractinium tetrahymenae]